MCAKGGVLMTLGIRAQALCAILKGVLIAVAVTATGMALLALLVVKFGLGDGALTVCNQAIKVASIVAGAYVAVGRGGTRGFVLGAATGLLYMIFSYALYCALGGEGVSAMLLTGEFAMGAAIGALSGALVANLRPGKKRLRTPKPKAKKAPVAS